MDNTLLHILIFFTCTKTLVESILKILHSFDTTTKGLTHKNILSDLNNNMIRPSPINIPTTLEQKILSEQKFHSTQLF